LTNTRVISSSPAAACSTSKQKLGGIQLEDRFVDVISMTLRIDPVVLSARREDPEVRRWLDVVKERYPGMKLIFARDKMDYARGVRQNLLSYEPFLQRNPHWRGKTLLIQVALLTGEKNNHLETTAAKIVTRVNSSWAHTIPHQPVLYVGHGIEYSQYLALLTVADALLITNQREGLNLTPQDYVFCQDGRYDQEKKYGSLILSEFTGSSSVLGGHHLLSTPGIMAHAQMQYGMPLKCPTMHDEKERRWKKLHETVTRYTASNWFSDFLLRLDRAYEEQDRRDQISVPMLSLKALSQKHSQSARRLFILDEATLVKWGPVGHIIPVTPEVCFLPRRTQACFSRLVLIQLSRGES
jgi:trehalose 6-phosphate synthase/phosphatase